MACKIKTEYLQFLLRPGSRQSGLLEFLRVGAERVGQTKFAAMETAGLVEAQMVGKKKSLEVFDRA